MGSWTESCGISGITIEYGDPAGIVILVTRKNAGTRLRGVGSYFMQKELYTPLCPPIFGKYDEYGRIEDIERSCVVDYVEHIFNMKIEDVIEIAAGRREVPQGCVNTVPSLKDISHMFVSKKVYDACIDIGMGNVLDNFYLDEEQDRLSRVIAFTAMDRTLYSYIEGKKDDLFAFDSLNKAVFNFAAVLDTMHWTNTMLRPSYSGAQWGDHKMELALRELSCEILRDRISRSEDDHEEVVDHGADLDKLLCENGLVREFKKMVKADKDEDWFPCYPGHMVEVSIFISPSGYKGGEYTVSMSVSGNDDFAMYLRGPSLYYDSAVKYLERLKSSMFDEVPDGVSYSWFQERGFVTE